SYPGLPSFPTRRSSDLTLVIFTSDNGPWIREKQEGGSAGPFFEGKGSTYEGGMRVPAIAWWPGTIQPHRTTAALATTMDLYPTRSEEHTSELQSRENLV